MNPKRSDSARTQQVGDEGLVLHQEQGQVHQLNSTAFWVFEQCDGETPVESMVEALTAQYDIDRETAVRDVETTLEQLAALALVVWPAE